MKLNINLLVLVFGILFLGCDEELPPQNNPTLLFTSSVSEQYMYVPESMPSQNFIDIYIVYKNLYDETLEDIASMTGTITIKWIAPPEDQGSFNATRSDELTSDNLFAAKNYNFASRKIVIDPNDSIVIRYRWDLKTDDSTNLINEVKYFAENNCYVILSPGGFPGHRRVSLKQQFQISAKFKILRQGGTLVTTPASFYSCWIAPHYGEASPPCDPPNPYHPCEGIIQP